MKPLIQYFHHTVTMPMPIYIYTYQCVLMNEHRSVSILTGIVTIGRPWHPYRLVFCIWTYGNSEMKVSPRQSWNIICLLIARYYFAISDGMTAMVMVINVLTIICNIIVLRMAGQYGVRMSDTFRRTIFGCLGRCLCCKYKINPHSSFKIQKRIDEPNTLVTNHTTGSWASQITILL